MEIIVHGTKGGYCVFNQKTLLGLFDVNPDTSRVTAIGQEAYSIHFSENNCFFSKYKIIRDVAGDKRTGFVAFSLRLSNKEKMKGEDVISILDSIFDKYCSEYIIDNNLDNVREEWSFIDNIIKKYESGCKSNDDEGLLSGTKDAAYIYYKDNNELLKYFDAPFQEEYSEYKQVFFINEELRDKSENPLNALRHSDNDLTGKIALDNPKYKILFNEIEDKELKIEVRVNGKRIYNTNKVKRKSDLEIVYRQKFRIEKTINGTWSEIKQKDPDYIEVDDEKATVKIKPIPLESEQKTIIITVKDANGYPISNSKITCENKYSEKRKNGSPIVFEGDDIGEQWKITINSDDYEPETFSINPQHEKSPIEKCLQKRGTGGHKKNGNNSKKYGIKINEKYGKIQGNEQLRHDYVVTAKPDFKVTPKIGFKFIGWELTEYKYDKYDGYYEALFKPIISLKQSIILVNVILIITLGSWGVYHLFKTDKTEPNQITIEQAERYVHDIVLNPDTLEYYKIHLPKPEIGKNSIWNLLPWGDNQVTDSTAQKKYDEVLQKIENAIVLRNKIKDGKLDEIKKDTSIVDSDKQKSFIETIKKIDTALLKNVGDSLKKIPNSNKLTLIEIAQKIDSIINEIEKKEKQKRTEDNQRAIPQTHQAGTSTNTNTNLTQPNSTPSLSDTDNEFIKKLKGSDISEQELSEIFRKTTSKPLKNSIDLYREFFKKIKDKGQKEVFDKLYVSVVKDENLQKSDLKNFLYSICESSDAFKKYSAVPGKENCVTLNDLKNKIK